ncbi:MAG: hypothetical protein J5522_04090 [Lachnospiraceae bacterium]|nr:hypothetical protein [Lachnospiraceae bacterium]
MNEMPVTTKVDGGVCWEHTFERFSAVCYVPDNDKDDSLLNYGFIAPYLLVFAPEKFSFEKAVAFAKEKGFEQLAKDYASSVLFIYPTADDWKNADTKIFDEILENSKLCQYYENGMAKWWNRFTHKMEDYFIRGAIFRSNLYGFGESADYIAKNCLKHFKGAGVWFNDADSAAVTCILENLSVIPEVEAFDIPVISIGNSAEINNVLKEKVTYLYIKDKADTVTDYNYFSKKFRRMLGALELDPDLEAEGMVIEPGSETLKTSPDNNGDDRGTETHRVGYFAFYNKDLFDKGPAPMLLAFHGGGDNAFYISYISGWANIAHRHNFLLVAIEHHLNSTATEMTALIEKLKEKYNIDTTRIYCSGFSMGGCKSWDFIAEHPEFLAAAAPMDATFEMGVNVFGHPSPYEFNTTVPVPVFYAGGEITPLPELPFQAQKCLDRIKYILELNGSVAASGNPDTTAADNVKEAVTKGITSDLSKGITRTYDAVFADKDNWANKIWGINGDESYRTFDLSKKAVLTIELFKNGEGKCYNALASISGQAHECREHTCENAWRFMSNFRRLSDGTIEGGDYETVKRSFTPQM